MKLVQSIAIGLVAGAFIGATLTSYVKIAQIAAAVDSHTWKLARIERAIGELSP